MLPTAVRETDPASPPRRRRRWVIALVALLVVAVAAGTGAWYAFGRSEPETASDPALQGTDKPRQAVTAAKIGVFRGTDANSAKEFSAWLGRPVDYAVDFSMRGSWQDIADPRYMIDHWRGSGFRSVYSLAMLPTDDGSASVEQGAGGAYDQYFRQLGQTLVTAGQGDTILRVGWEFNLESSRWATDDAKAWAAYYRRIVAAMRSVPGQQFQFDWNPNNGNNPHDAVDYYPGDDVVDYIGVDAYDVGYVGDSYPYPQDCDQSCRLERQQNAWAKGIYGGKRGLKFWSAFAKHHGKPISLPEWGLWNRLDGHGGGENEYYLEQMHAFITDPANDVAYQAYFEFDGDDGTHRLMTDYPAAGQKFRALFARP